MITYSEVKERLNIDDKSFGDNGLASLTHYLQNYNEKNNSAFEEGAIEYIRRSNKFETEEPLFSEYLPLKWDVPFPPHEIGNFKFIDLFAGIGGFRLAFHNLGGKCVFSSEWNKYAQQTYHANFGEVPFGDITQIDAKEIPDHDILIAGFPCQPFSIAGVSKKKSLGRAHGFDDELQGNLFFDIKRILEEKRPKAFLLENVKNLVSHDKGNTFKVISKTLKRLGYNIHCKVLDGKHFVPQHRERILIIGFDRERYNGDEKFEFPELPSANHQIKDILQENINPKYTLSDGLWSYLQAYAAKHKAKGNGFGFGMTELDGISRTLSARYYKDGSEVLIPQKNQNPRKLTPRECARLQGFPDNFVIPVSDTQAYKQFGNSVVRPLMQFVGEALIEELSKLDGGITTSDKLRTAV
ncbi:MAG: DNA (cytosine-5-)-methyltransferase [Flavobacteriales bacterium]|nr:DNA (cytosine-5-)-methyltransferase [Flavobacteriales bacterium]